MQAAERKPNIIIFFADDLGYNDLGMRNKTFSTPNIDRFAGQSINFENAYVPSPTSSPSRAGLLTGRHPLKVGIVRHINLNEERYGANGEFGVSQTDPARIPSRLFMPLSEVTLAEVLKQAGYYTAIIGKWHLGREEHYPDKQGFDHLFGVTSLGQPVNYYPPYFTRPSTGRTGEYLNDYLTDDAVRLIKGHGHSEQPLLLYFPHYAVHTPHIGKTERTKHYNEQGFEGNFANFLSMVESFDDSFGRVLEAVRESGMADNTIIILTSDQGGFFSNAPLKGGKLNAMALYEGGAKVPFFFHYAKYSKPRTVKTPISTLDIFPTLLDLAGVKYDNRAVLDGMSLYGIIARNKELAPRPLYFYRSYEDRYASILSGGIKYIATRSGDDEAYDLRRDPGEERNIIADAKYAKQLGKLRANLASFVKENEPASVPPK